MVIWKNKTNEDYSNQQIWVNKNKARVEIRKCDELGGNENIRE